MISQAQTWTQAGQDSMAIPTVGSEEKKPIGTYFQSSKFGGQQPTESGFTWRTPQSALGSAKSRLPFPSSSSPLWVFLPHAFLLLFSCSSVP